MHATLNPLCCLSFGSRKRQSPKKIKSTNKNAVLQVKCCLILGEDFRDQQKQQGSPHLWLMVSVCAIADWATSTTLLFKHLMACTHLIVCSASRLVTETYTCSTEHWIQSNKSGLLGARLAKEHTTGLWHLGWEPGLSPFTPRFLTHLFLYRVDCWKTKHN